MYDPHLGEMEGTPHSGYANQGRTKMIHLKRLLIGLGITGFIGFGFYFSNVVLSIVIILALLMLTYLVGFLALSFYEEVIKGEYSE